MQRKTMFVTLLALSLFLLPGIIRVQTVFASYILGINDLKKHGGWNFQSFNLDDNTMAGLNYTGDSFKEMENLAYGGGNTYYGIESFNNTGKNSTLYSFEWDGDTVTGTAGENTFDASNIDAATFVDGLLYAFDNNTDMLTKINLDGEKVGETKVTGFDSKKKFEGLAYGSDGLLYGSLTKGGNSWLYSMDITNPNIVANEIGKIQLGKKSFGQVEALTFLDDVLYGVGGKGWKNNPLIKIDTGNGSVFGEPVNWGSGDIEGIAAGGSAAVPEPATILLLGFGLLGFAGSRVKKFMGKLRREVH